MTKFVICFDTICQGYQPVMEGDQPARYDTEAEAQAELDSDPEFYGDDCFVCEETEIGHKTIFYGSK